MLGAPFLFLEMWTNKNGNTFNTSLTGVYDLLYMLGWMCSVTAFWRMRAGGTNNWGKVVFYIQLLFLSLANVANVWVIINPASGSIIYRVLDMFWPVSNLWMLAVGITLLRAGLLQGWRRYVVLAVGLWLPVIMGVAVVAGKTEVMFYVCGIYSTVAWTVMGWAVFTTGKKEEPRFELAL